MQINILSFTPTTERVNLDVYTDKVEYQHPHSVFKDELPELWDQNPELADKERLFFSVNNTQTECKGDKYSISFNLNDQPRIAKLIISRQILNYFRSVAIADYDFVDNVEVWVKDSVQADNRTTQYRRFTLSPQYKNVTVGWELLVSFDGCSSVYNTAIDSLDIQSEHYKVIANGEIVKYKNLSPQHKQNISNIFPIINRELAAEFNITENHTRTENRYNLVYQRISDFAKQFLFTAEFQEIIIFNSQQFVTVPSKNIFSVSTNANSLLFGNGKVGFVQYKGITDNGPFAPTPKNNIRFFFIYHQNDVGVCKKLYDIFTNGIKNTDKYTGEIKIKFPPLSQYIRQSFNTEKGGSIVFNDYNNAIQEISKKLSCKKLENDSTYVALYISPFNKDDVSNPLHDVYYRVKELLLQKGITSQVIYKENPNKSSFNFHLPNIAIALLAKIGGIPWQLPSTSNKNDLIVGVGAFKSYRVGQRYIGSAFRFNKDGIFQNFNCYRDDKLENLVADIRKALGHFMVDSNNPERIIIHYYKTMSKRESKPITDMLYKLGFNIPIFIVTINKTEASDIVAFDNQSSDLMPLSGTIIRVKKQQFLLFNNDKYQNSNRPNFLFPIKVKISKIVNKGCTTDTELSGTEIQEILNQVYQFSRMYWKSVKQQNLPITIIYPEMVAEFTPHFSEAELPPFGKTNLWFL